eukprot:COSAG06_NODE_402_length_16190_cov_18.069045_12_plen_228_part_00
MRSALGTAVDAGDTRTTCPSWAANLGQEWPTGLPTAQYASDSVWFSASSAGASTSRSICLARTYPFRRGTGFFRRCRDSHCGEHLRDHGARHQPPCPPRPQGAAATGARSDAHGRHDLQRVRGCGHDQETSLLLPCAAVPAPDCSSPPTGPLPPPPPQPVRTGGWSVPVGARSRPPTLPTDKEKVGSARKPNSGRDSWHGAGGLCDDPALGHLGCARCGWRQAGDGG